VTSAERALTLARNESAWQELSKLDGCYCLKTDLANARAAKELVHDRYKDLAEVGLYYRQCKQTFDRGKLRSRNPGNAMVELHWSLLGMWVMGLHSHSHLLKQEIPPERMSFAGIWRTYRRPMREYKSQPDPGERMTEILDRAVIDPYRRKNKASRDYPRQKQERPAGPPIIQKATRKQIKQARCVKLLQEKG
jgi:hypothetical protein